VIGWLESHSHIARDLWILGDLFEVWVGDDTIDDPLERDWLEPILHALRAFSAPLDGQGPGKIHLIRGNRDFLLGERFALSTSITMVEEPAKVMIGGVPTLLLHGDTLCTDDVAYQTFRSEVRTPQWTSAFLARSYVERRAIAAQMRDASRAAGAAKASTIMDANPATATKPRRPAAPAPADSYTSRGGVPQSSTEETHLSNGLVCKTEKGQRTCR
jgi:UDP-2,3-diacylglucosamine hydrolase